MKFTLKRFGVLLAALMLLIFPLGWLTPAAFAAGTEGTGAYVFRYMPDSLPANYGYTMPYFSVSPFAMRHTVTQDNGARDTSDGFPRIFNLINTAKLESGGAGAYASIAAYCADAFADIRENTRYRRINLEDSGLENETAGKLRAVVLNAYPRKTVKAIQARANSWLRHQGLPEIVELQSGEAILAAQAVIWKLTGGNQYAIQSFYSGQADPGNPEDVIDISPMDQCETEHTVQNVESLYNYLSNLAAKRPRYDAISEASLEAPGYTAVQEADGTYTVTAAVTVNATVSEWDSLALSAACGGQLQNRTITNAGEYSFRFQGLSECFEVKVEISGEQYGGDVYLFDAEGERGSRQTLVGYDSSRIPVHGEILLTPQPEDNAAAEYPPTDDAAADWMGSIQGMAAQHAGGSGISAVTLRADLQSADATLPDTQTTVAGKGTGGVDTALIHATGAAIVGSACLLLLNNRNRRA